MSGPGQSTYRKQPSIWWWTRKRSYLMFAMRELSSVFVAWLVVFLLLFVWNVSRGGEEYRQFLDVAANPALVAVNVVALTFLLLHTVTWFNLTPKAMPLKAPGGGGRRVPAAAMIASQWAGFVVVAAVVVWLVV